MLDDSGVFYSFAWFIVKSAFWSLFNQLVTAVRLLPMHMSQTQWLNIVYLEAKLGGRNRGWKRDENVALHNKDSFYLPYNRSVEFLFHPGTKVQPRILEFKVRLGISGRSNFFQVERKKTTWDFCWYLYVMNDRMTVITFSILENGLELLNQWNSSAEASQWDG